MKNFVVPMKYTFQRAHSDPNDRIECLFYFFGNLKKKKQIECTKNIAFSTSSRSTGKISRNISTIIAATGDGYMSRFLMFTEYLVSFFDEE